MSKPTLATVKSFVRKNINNLIVMEKSRFDGQVDCVMESKCEWKVNPSDYKPTEKNDLGVFGIWFVGSSRDLITEIDGGFNVWNCCGEFNIIKGAN
jgi:hypothetical protein